MLARVEEVEREQLGVLARMLLLEPLVGLADLRVQLAAAPVREPFVRRVAEERVPEAEGACGVRVALDELVQPVPGLGVGRGGGILAQHLVHEVGAERRAQDRRVAQQRAVARRQPVDAGGDDRLDAFRQRLVLRCA